MRRSEMYPDRTPVVVCAGFDWRHPSPVRHLELALARDHRVLHVESLALRAPAGTRADLRRAAFKLGRLVGWTDPAGPPRHGFPGGGLRIVAPALPAVGPDGWRRLAARALEAQVRRALRPWGVRRPWLFLTALPTALPLLRRLEPAVSAYYRVDDWVQWPGIDPVRIPALERRLMDRVDHTFCTARALLDGAWSRRGAPIPLPQGVDRRHFGRALEPGPVWPALAALPRPVLGFFGSLDDRLDPALLEALAGWRGSVVFAGPRLAGAPAWPAGDRLRWLGPVPYDDLPQLARGIDAWVLPYVVSARTAAIDPLKLREYLATGRPVAATALPEVRPWRAHVQVAARGGAAFLGAVERALRDDEAAREARLAALAGHTWEDRRRTLLRAVCAVAPAPAS